MQLEEKCPLCKVGTLHVASEESRFDVGGQAYIGLVACDLCDACGESFTSSDDLRDFEVRTVRSVIARRIVNGDTLKFIRTHGLGMPVAQVAHCVGIPTEELQQAEVSAEVPLHLWRYVATMALQVLAGVETIESLMNDATGAVSMHPVRVDAA